ncbi:RelA/SpoT family protein [Sulfurimonas sp. HSL-1656]|uniref:RelA/SpoT family protein n=1 Tax=Thiomicrolovo subterrani TaxID=3131934 RepID=UPI0031F88C09
MANNFDINQIRSIRDIESATALLHENIAFDELIEDALLFSKDAHAHQTRKSGEPYVVHPILVSALVASITGDRAMVIAALLHDVVEDTPNTIEAVEMRYGSDVAHLVHGLTKIDLIRDKELIPSHSDEKLVVSALTFRKMLLASIKDIRVLVVKLCDRLHNMLTLDALPEAKQRRIAEETLVVYAPIAHRLGISYIKNFLEDLSFTYVFADEKKRIDDYLKANYHDIELRLNGFRQKIAKLMERHGIMPGSYEILSRIKHDYSIYLKMQRKGISIDEVLDLLAIRVLVNDPTQCYSVLGLVHLHFQPLTSRFKDYIAIPKENGYQTLHTTVFDDTSIIEVQIRTFEMHKTAELGVAAHWKYKSGGNNINLDWLQNLQYQEESIEDFYELAKTDLYSEDISVFSPKGKPYTLPRGATALDFAYAVHTEIGDRAESCLVNKESKSLLAELHNGDIVRIMTSEEKQLRCSWMDAVKTSRAKQHIRINCRHRIRDIDSKSGLLIMRGVMQLNVTRIREWLREHNRLQNAWMIARDVDYLREVLHHYLKALRSHKKFGAFLATHRFKLKLYRFGSIELFSNHTISDVVFDFCCHPKAGDEIVGFVSNGKAHIHHKMCQHAATLIEDEEPMLFVRWKQESIFHYHMIVSMHNAKGALADFLTFLAKLGAEIVSIELGKERQEHQQLCELEFQSSEADINRLRAKIEQKIHIIQFIRTDDAYRSV